MLGVAAFAVLMVMRDRPSDVGLRPFGDEGTEPLPAPPPNNAPIMAAALGTLRDASKSQRVLDPVRHLLHLRRLAPTAWSRCI